MKIIIQNKRKLIIALILSLIIIVFASPYFYDKYKENLYERYAKEASEKLKSRDGDFDFWIEKMKFDYFSGNCVAAGITAWHAINETEGVEDENNSITEGVISSIYDSLYIKDKCKENIENGLSKKQFIDLVIKEIDITNPLQGILLKSRAYFDKEIEKFNKASTDIKSIEDKLTHLISYNGIKVKEEDFPKYGIEIKKSLDYGSIPQKGWYENAEITYLLGDYKLVISSPWDKEYKSFFSDNDDLQYTKLSILKDGKVVTSKEVPILYPDQIQEIYLDNVHYINILLNDGSMHGCCSIISVVYDTNKNEAPKMGSKVMYSDEAYEPEINTKVFSKNGNLYINLVGSTFSYPAARSATVPMIYKVDRNTADLIFANKEFTGLYSDSAKIAKGQLNKSRSFYKKGDPENNISVNDAHDRVDPYFYYYNEMMLLGMVDINEYDNAIKNSVDMYKNFFGEGTVLNKDYLYGYKNWSTKK